jgi:hypothetical protein
MIENRRGAGKRLALQRWILEHPDVYFTNQEAADAVEWNASSVASALRAFDAAFPQLTKPQRGVWMWRSGAPGPVPPALRTPPAAASRNGTAPPTKVVEAAPVAPEPRPSAPKETMLVAVLKTRPDGTRIVIADDGDVYTLKPLDV